ncbi:MAG: hypothetical protein J0L62_03040 [Bacteroidetes bacterium]|nr:hypothetical protein [Bacteroidota bacterium]
MLKYLFTVFILIETTFLFGQVKLPGWTTLTPEENDEFKYVVGVSGNTRSVKEARDQALRNAIDQIIQSMGISASSSGGMLQSEARTETSISILYKSKNVLLKDFSVVEFAKEENQNGTLTGYVLMRFSKVAIDEAKGELQAGEEKKSMAIKTRLLKAESLVDDLDFHGAFSLLLRIFLESENGQNDIADAMVRVINEVRMTKSESPEKTEIVVKSKDGVPIPNFQIKVKLKGQEDSELFSTNENGIVELTRKNIQSIALGFEESLIQVSIPSEKKEFLIPVVNQLKSKRITFSYSVKENKKIFILVKESTDEKLNKRSVFSAEFGKALIDLGYKLVSDTQIGKDNRKLIESMIGDENFDPKYSALLKQTDWVVFGEIESKYSSLTEGIYCYSTEGTITITDMKTGESVAVSSFESVKGFGNSREKAAKNAIVEFVRQSKNDLIERVSNN